MRAMRGFSSTAAAYRSQVPSNNHQTARQHKPIRINTCEPHQSKGLDLLCHEHLQKKHRGRTHHSTKQRLLNESLKSLEDIPAPPHIWSAAAGRRFYGANHIYQVAVL